MLRHRAKQTEHWNGVRNYQARNFIRYEIKKGDRLSVMPVSEETWVSWDWNELTVTVETILCHYHNVNPLQGSRHSSQAVTPATHQCRQNHGLNFPGSRGELPNQRRNSG